MVLFDVGDVAKLRAEFYGVQDNGSSVLMNPTAVSVWLRSPSGTETEYTSGIDNPTTGVYTFETDAFTLAGVGVWRYRFEGTGVVTAAEEGRFTVRASGFTTI